MPLPPLPSPPPTELADDLLREVFLRLPPDDTTCLLHASLACNRWRHILGDPTFRRRHREHHGTASVVGFLRVEDGEVPTVSCFVSTNPAHGCPPARHHFPGQLVLDCRHGRVLLLKPSPSLGAHLNYDLVVWDPLTNSRRCLPRLSPSPMDVCGPHFNAAVLCSAERCEDHSECHAGGAPFRVAFVWSRTSATSARVYSSGTGDWSESVSVRHFSVFAVDEMPCPSTLVGDTLYFRFGISYALRYQLGAQRLSVIQGPPLQISGWINLMSMEEGGRRLGCVDVEEDESGLRLRLWSREAASERWKRGRAIELGKLLPDGALSSPRFTSSTPDFRIRSVELFGLAEGTDIIFVGTQAPYHSDAVYMVQLNSGRARKVFDQYAFDVPYTSFCIPVTGVSSITEGPGDDVSCA